MEQSKKIAINLLQKNKNVQNTLNGLHFQITNKQLTNIELVNLKKIIFYLTLFYNER